MQASVRHGLEQIVGRTLVPSSTPEPMALSSAEIALETDVAQLTARAMANRPDLRQIQLDLAARRLQTGLAVGSHSASLLQLQMTVIQLQDGTIKAQTEALQAMLNAQGSLEELKAREAVLSPAQEAAANLILGLARLAQATGDL